MTAKTITGTVLMTDGTRRAARSTAEDVVEFRTFGNANARAGHSWRKASAKQAASFVPDNN
jgi:hypothetical protein